MPACMLSSRSTGPATGVTVHGNACKACPSALRWGNAVSDVRQDASEAMSVSGRSAGGHAGIQAPLRPSLCFWVPCVRPARAAAGAVKTAR